jgi:lipopolysaccharide export LptBFGC system permease protein LptF
MSSTLFKYIFRDLLRIFLLTSGALAGIMSFGGLLRPLTEHGLDAGQAAKMLSFFMPAMTTYSLPIPAAGSWVGTTLAFQGVRLELVGGSPTFVPLNAVVLMLGL